MRAVAFSVGTLLGFLMARRLSSGYRHEASPFSGQLSTGDAAILSAFHRDRLIFNKGHRRDIPYVAGGG